MVHSKSWRSAFIAAGWMALLASPAFADPPPGGEETPAPEEPSLPRLSAEPEPPPPPPPPPAGRTEAAQADGGEHAPPGHCCPRPGEPVVRAAAGDYGMFFRFGGLASLLASGNTRNVNSLLLTQVGMKKVLSDDLMIPFYFGTGVRHISEDAGNDSATDFGIDLGAGIEWHFRTWRRISPFIGASLGLAILDPDGDDNHTIGVGIGPNVGVEYYVADRLSLTAMYLLTFQFENGAPLGSNDKLTTIQLSTLSGGAMNLTFYF